MKKEKNLNNRGFTLIEVLAVIVILVIIVSIAIPNISASLDRQSCKTTINKTKLIESAAQFYVSDNRNAVRDKLNDLSEKKCKIDTCLLEGKDIESSSCAETFAQKNKKYINSDDLVDGNNQGFSGYVAYNQDDETYTFCFEPINSCQEDPQPSICSDVEDIKCY